MNILIVDDQPAVLSSIVSFLSSDYAQNDQLFTATSVLLAKRVFQKYQIDILLTDIEMPVENGLSLISWVREQDYSTECILITSHSDFIYAKQAISLGVLEYVLQPAKNEDILNAIKHAKLRLEKTHLVEKRLAASQFSTIEANRSARRFFETWPTSKQISDNPGILLEKKNRLNMLGIPCGIDDLCVLLILRIDAWNSLPLPAPDLRSHLEAIANDVFSYFSGTQTSHYIKDSLWVFFLHAPTYSGIADYLHVLLDRYEQELNFTASVFYNITDFRKIYYSYNYMINLEELQDNEPQEVSIVEITLPNDYMNLTMASTNIRNYFEQISIFVKDNITNPLTRQDIANHIHISPDYVSHIVRQVTGNSCKEYIKIEKMKYAKSLLETTDMPVGDIAEKCGFDSFAYFSKVYKSVYGVSPRNERKKHS